MSDTKPTSAFAKITRAAIPAGMVCVLLALVAQYILPAAKLHSSIVIAPLTLGAALFFLGILCNLKWLWRTIRQRRFLIGLNVWIMIILGLIILTVANVIVVKTPETESWYLDCTADRLFTLSEKTLNILNGLTEDVQVTLLAGDGTVSLEGQGKINIGKRVKDVLGIYGASSPRVHIEIIDVYRETLRAEQVSQRIGKPAQPDTILIEYGDRAKILRYFDLIRVDGFTPMFLGEEKITATILGLSEPHESNIYFVIGHGEWGPEGPADASLGKFTEALRADNCRVATVNLMRLARIPEKCDLLIIAGPTASFDKTETDILRDWLDQGGRLMVLVQPNAAQGRMRGLDALLGEHNIEVDDRRIVIDNSRNAPDLRVLVQDFSQHIITEGLRNINCLLPNASPVGPLVDTTGAVGLTSPYEVTSLLQSLPQSWAESSLNSQVKYDKGADTQGPLSLAVAVERRQPTERDSESNMRIVVIGSTAAALDAPFETYPGNKALMMNSVAWLMDTENKLGIPPQPSEQRRLKEDATAWKIVFVITVLGMPLAAMLAGLCIWIVRRRA